MSYLHFFSALKDILAGIAVGGGYVSLFFVTLLEGIPLLGIFIPGHVVVVGAGFLASIGILNPTAVILIASAGAILGDFASFFLGRIFGWPLIDRLRKLFFVKDLHIEKAKRLLKANTGKALVIGRFNPVTRGLMPFLVGANHIPVGSFWIWNFIGAIAWVATSVIIGYGVGFGYHFAAGFLGRLVVIAIIAGALIAWGYRFINIRFHIFRRYDLFALGLNLISLYVLARMIQDAFAVHSFMAGFDLWVNGSMTSFVLSASGPLWVSIASQVSAWGGTNSMIILTVALGIALASFRKWRSAIIMLMSAGSTAFLVGWLKDFFLRARPSDLLIPFVQSPFGFLFDQPSLMSDPSFPSAHAAFAAAFFLVAAYLWSPRFRSWVWRELFIAACVLIPIAVGLSRLVLNVHWASDVIAGWSLGVFCATASILLVRYVGALIYEKVGN